MQKSWSISDSPGNNGSPSDSSPRMHPKQFDAKSTYCPDVHLFPIIVSEEKFRRSVPPGSYVVCKCSSFVIENASKSEITNSKFVSLSTLITLKILRIDQ